MQRPHEQNGAILVEGNGSVVRYTSIGCYPVFYVTADDGALCPTCVEENLEQCADMTEGGAEFKQWRVAAHDVNWEDPALECDHCGERIPSAYAEDDAPPDEPDEGDYTTEDHKTFFQYGKIVLVLDEDADMWGELRAHMDREKFWPNVWFISDHGNAHRLTQNETE